MRFLAWYSHTYDVQNPTIDLLAKPDIGAKAQAYAEWLQSKELQWSSISNYLSALIQCAVYACTLVDGDVPEHSELCNLRRQCDKYANESSLYRRRSDNWIPWGAPACHSYPHVEALCSKCPFVLRR